MMMNILAVPLTQLFYYLHFQKMHNMKGCLLINKMQSQILNPLNVYTEWLFVLWQVVYKYCDKSFINKPTFI